MNSEIDSEKGTELEEEIESEEETTRPKPSLNLRQLGKYWRELLIIGIALILIFAILIQALKSEGGFAAAVFNFFNDWAPVLSATAMLALVLVVFWSVRKMIEENRLSRDEISQLWASERELWAAERELWASERDLDFRRRSLDGIINWAQEARRYLVASKYAFGFVELEEGLQGVIITNHWAVATAGIFSAEFQEKVEKAADELTGYIQALKRRNEFTLNYRKPVIDYFDQVLDGAYKLTAA